MSTARDFDAYGMALFVCLFSSYRDLIIHVSLGRPDGRFKSQVTYK